MKKNLLFLLFISLMLTGCSVDYNLIINDKKEVEEVATISSTNQEILSHNESINLYLTEQINTYSQIYKYRNYQYTKNIGELSSNIAMKRTYSSLTNYIGSPIFKYLFENATIIQNVEYTSFKTVGLYYYNHLYAEKEQADLEFYIDAVNIRIKFYNKIIESNADKVDKKNNILEWNITSQDHQKSIYFKISNEKKYDVIVSDFLAKSKDVIITISILIVLVIFIVLYIAKKFKKNNAV